MLIKEEGVKINVTTERVCFTVWDKIITTSGNKKINNSK